MKLTSKQRKTILDDFSSSVFYGENENQIVDKDVIAFLSRALELLDIQELSPEDKAKVFVEGLTYEDLKTPVRDLLVRLQRAPNPFYEGDAVRIFVEALDSLKILEE